MHKFDLPWRQISTQGEGDPHGEESLGWVEPFAKPITVVANMMGIASLNPSYALRAETVIASQRVARMRAR